MPKRSARRGSSLRGRRSWESSTSHSPPSIWRIPRPTPSPASGAWRSRAWPLQSGGRTSPPRVPPGSGASRSRQSAASRTSFQL
eukprot:7508054-Pyramimonas_sp.AAC.1